MAVTLNGTNGLTFNDGSSQATAATGFGFKNRILNGGMVIDQRNAGASVATTTTGNSSVYALDRWSYYVAQASKFTIQQNAGSVTPPTGFTKYLGCTSTSAYSLGASDYFLINQKIEGLNTVDLAWGTASAATVTLSFWVRSSLTGTFGGVITNNGQSRSYAFSYSISVANTWTQISVTIAGDTSGTWATDNGIGVWVMFSLGTGSSLSGSAGVWGNTTLGSVTGATSVVGTSGATFYITGVQLEKGSTATSFDYRPYGTELALCQRYYETSYDIGTVPASATTTSIKFLSWAINGTNGGNGGITFLVPKRAVPTVATYDGAGTVNNVATSTAAANPTFTNGRAYQGAPGNISTTGFIHWGQGIIGNVNNYIHFIASAEL